MLGMVESLQILIFLPLLKTSMPANVGDFMGFLMTIAAFDIVNTGPTVELVFDLEPIAAPEDINYTALGLGSVYFVSNLGSAVFIFMAQVALSFLYFIVKPFRHDSKCLNRFYKRLMKGLYWNNWLILVKESYMVICLSAFISFKYYFNFNECNVIYTTYTL